MSGCLREELLRPKKVRKTLTISNFNSQERIYIKIIFPDFFLLIPKYAQYIMK